MFNRIENTFTLRALALAGLIMGSLGSTAFAAAPAHMATKNAGAHAFSPGRANTGPQTPGPIFSRGYYVGQDPDQSIRFQLVRDGWYGTR
jgi:hypothetical protein